MRTFGAFLFAVMMLGIAGCGSSKNTQFAGDPELEALFQGADYKSITDAARYDIALYYLKHGDSANGRSILEDIVTYNNYIPSIKYQLACIYLQKESVSFTVKNEKGDPIASTQNAGELAEALLKEVLDEDPTYYVASSELMMLALQRGDTAQFSRTYEKASTAEKSFLGADYRLAYLTAVSKEDSNGAQNGLEIFTKARKTYSELYDSYKSLGDIQRVQFQDTLAYKSYKKVFDYQSEATDLFLVYYHLAEICARIYATKGDQKYRDEALQYACKSLTRFPGYTPALGLIRRLANVQSTADSVKAPNDYAAPFRNYCGGQFSDLSLRAVESQSGVLPRSIFRETFQEQKNKK